MSYPKKTWVENTPVGGKDGGAFEIVAQAGYGSCASFPLLLIRTLFRVCCRGSESY